MKNLAPEDDILLRNVGDCDDKLRAEFRFQALQYQTIFTENKSAIFIYMLSAIEFMFQVTVIDPALFLIFLGEVEAVIRRLRCPREA